MSKITSLFVAFFVMASIALSQTPQDTVIEHHRRGIEFLKNQKFEEALSAFRSAAKLDPRSAATQGNIGASLMALKRPAEAVAAFREATKLAPADGTFQTALCRALVATDKYDEAVKACEEGVRLDPDSQRSHLALL